MRGRRALGRVLTLPSRDGFRRGTLASGVVAALTAWEIAEVTGSASFGTGVSLGFVLAVTAAMPRISEWSRELCAVAGTVLTAMDLMTGGACGSPAEPAVRFGAAVGIVAFLVAVSALRLVVAPVRPRYNGAVRPSLTAVFAVTATGLTAAELVAEDLLTVPDLLTVASGVVFLAVIAFGLALLPLETSTLLAGGVLVLNVVMLTGGRAPGCHGTAVATGTVIAYLVTIFITARFARTG